MENAFKQLVEEHSPEQEELKSEVMANIALKNFLFHILELFTAILGITAIAAVAPRQSPLASKDQDAPRPETDLSQPNNT